MHKNLFALCRVVHDAKLRRPKLDKIISKRLRSVLISAYLNVPYYRELMKSIGYNPLLHFSGPEDLTLFPVTTKEIIKNEGIRVFTNKDCNLSNSFCESTSGSTGIPLRVYRSHYERAIQMAKWLHVLFINGYSVRDKVMALTSTDRPISYNSFIQRFGLLRRLVLFDSLTPEEVVDIFLDYMPSVLYGSQSFLDLMALELKRRRIIPENLKLLVSTGDIIHSNSRLLCNKHFGINITESYGSVEMGVMAYETPSREGLHLCEGFTFFEFLDWEGKSVPPGKLGRVVVTDLHGKLMPFIRYDQGDLAVYKKKGYDEGTMLRKLTRILGREDEYIILPDGTQITAYDLYSILSKYENIFQFRVVQKKRDLIQIIINAEADFIRTIRNNLVHQLNGKLGTEMKVEISVCDRIAPDLSGKRRAFISEIDE
ncbi:phenylacetate--CoA ligase family protein [Acidobacteriota bacterium]